MPLPDRNIGYESDAMQVARAIDNLYSSLISLEYTPQDALALTVAYIRSGQ